MISVEARRDYHRRGVDGLRADALAWDRVRVTVTQEPTPAPLVIGGRQIPTMTIGDYMADRVDRATSFITNFGDWQLPADAAAAFASPVVHLEWFHNTGELTAFGQVPHLGHGDIEISSAQSAIDTVGAAIGTAGGRVVHTDGATHEWFPAMVIGASTVVAVLAHVEHGPRVHELLWGWHTEHRHDDGWNWLTDRLAATS